MLASPQVALLTHCPHYPAHTWFSLRNREALNSLPVNQTIFDKNGQPVTAVQATNLGSEQSIVLTIDHSRSMHGKPLAEAVAAAQTFIQAKPNADQIAVVAFASQAVSLSDFSNSTSDASDALSGLRIDPNYGTVLYDAIIQAAQELRAHGLPGRVVILVTDGQETTSKATLNQTIRAARAARAAIYVIAIRSGTFLPMHLRDLARQTGGRYSQAPTRAALDGIYRQIGAELRRTWEIQYATAARPGDLIRLEASAGPARGTFTERLPGLPAAQPSSGLPVSLIVGLVVVIGVLAGVAFSPLFSRLSRARRRRPGHS